MSDPKLSLAREWLAKSKGDLDSARKLAAEPDPILETAIYHCQQAAEKALKGLLVLRDQPFDKVHDVRPLISQASALQARFAGLMPEAELLTPYATLYRYPSEVPPPTTDKFEKAHAAAEKIIRFVLSLHPELDPTNQVAPTASQQTP